MRVKYYWLIINGYSTHLTDGWTEAQRGTDLPRTIEWFSGRNSKRTKESWLLVNCQTIYRKSNLPYGKVFHTVFIPRRHSAGNCLVCLVGTKCKYSLCQTLKWKLVQSVLHFMWIFENLLHDEWIVLFSLKTIASFSFYDKLSGNTWIPDSLNSLNCWETFSFRQRI